MDTLPRRSLLAAALLAALALGSMAPAPAAPGRIGSAADDPPPLAPVRDPAPEEPAPPQLIVAGDQATALRVCS